MDSNLELISELKKQILRKTISPPDFLQRLQNILKGTLRKGRIYYGTKDIPIRLFRSRVFQSLPNKINELSYPPLKNTKLGRLNLPGEQIFYSCAGFPTTFIELKDKIQIGTLVVVSEWQCYSDLILQEVGFTDSQNKGGYEDLLNLIFTAQNEEFYPYSSLISKYLMNGEKIAGVTYPSIEAQNQSQNIALKKEFVDKSLSCVNARACWIKTINPIFQFNVDWNNFATVDGDTFKWKDRLENWVIRENGGQRNMESFNGMWTARDISGKIVDPE